MNTNKRPLFDTNKEVAAYYKGRLRELAQRAGKTVPALLVYAEHCHRDSYVTRQARNFNRTIQAAKKIGDNAPAATKAYELIITWPNLDLKTQHSYPTLDKSFLYHDPVRADQDGQQSLAVGASRYEVRIRDFKD